MYCYLRVGLDHGEEMQHSTNVGGMKQYDQLQHGFMTGWGLKVQPRLLHWSTSIVDERMTWSSTWQHFLLGEVSGGHGFSGNLKPSYMKLDLRKNSSSTQNMFIVFHLILHHTSRITLSWVEILNQPMHSLTHTHSLNRPLPTLRYVNCNLGGGGAWN